MILDLNKSLYWLVNLTRRLWWAVVFASYFFIGWAFDSYWYCFSFNIIVKLSNSPLEGLGKCKKCAALEYGLPVNRYLLECGWSHGGKILESVIKWFRWSPINIFSLICFHLIRKGNAIANQRNIFQVQKVELFIFCPMTQSLFKGAQAWDIRLQGFSTNQACICWWSRN
jgi:hypothetical protein